MKSGLQCFLPWRFPEKNLVPPRVGAWNPPWNRPLWGTYPCGCGWSGNGNHHLKVFLDRNWTPPKKKMGCPRGWIGIRPERHGVHFGYIDLPSFKVHTDGTSHRIWNTCHETKWIINQHWLERSVCFCFFSLLSCVFRYRPFWCLLFVHSMFSSNPTCWLWESHGWSTEGGRTSQPLPISTFDSGQTLVHVGRGLTRCRTKMGSNFGDFTKWREFRNQQIPKWEYASGCSETTNMQNFGTQWSKSSSESISVCCFRSFGKARELGHLYVCVYRFKFIHVFTYGVGTHHSVGIGFVPNVFSSVEQSEIGLCYHYKMMIGYLFRLLEGGSIQESKTAKWLISCFLSRDFEGDHPKLQRGY